MLTARMRLLSASQACARGARKSKPRRGRNTEQCEALQASNATMFLFGHRFEFCKGSINAELRNNVASLYRQKQAFVGLCFARLYLSILSAWFFCFPWHLSQHPHRVTSGVNRPYAAVNWLTVTRVLRTMKGDGEQEETQSNGCRPKAYNATMFLIGHRFETVPIWYSYIFISIVANAGTSRACEGVVLTPKLYFYKTLCVARLYNR